MTADLEVPALGQREADDRLVGTVRIGEAPGQELETVEAGAVAAGERRDREVGVGGAEG